MGGMDIEFLIPLLIIIGFLSSILASLIGLGGGLVSIPLIMLVIGTDNSLEAKLIAYVSIFALACFALYRYLKQKRFPKWDKTLLIALGVVPVTVVSELYLGPLLQDYKLWFHILFIILIVIVIALINFKDKLNFKAPDWSLPLFGMLIGLASGSMGISGGVLFIPLLVIGLQMSLKEAAVNAIFLKIFAAAANITVGIASGQYDDFQSHGVEWYLPLIIIIGSIPGSFVGPMLSKRMKSGQIKLTFNVVMSIVLTWEIVLTILISQNIM